ncbi:MmgE/PrpD family protein [Pseudonocardia kujensis]|uniref:MmgE/PrpD family protein n=1 Tax=Pseudonocardia kujensis TaxID=1128675 RepID=UPI001E4BA5E0|nr:MmgE/PrpD family protein [Pseudonocardia kujensis]MCE0763520.1 MmgE/PrpD family protein [Pseudonocardia kujensis]
MLESARTGPIVSRWLAERALDLRYSDIPADVVDLAKTLLVDQLGLQVKGATLANTRPERLLVEQMGARPEATVTNTALRSTAAQAAYLNGTFGHSMEYDDCHTANWHAGSVVVPAAVAIAERDGRSGRDLLAAVVAGHQVMSVLGADRVDTMTARGWHGPKFLGVFAAAAVAARLTGSSVETLQNAFGIAGSEASGIMEYDQSGGEVKRLHAGSGARSGIEALELARFGLTGPTTVFEGKRGVLQILGGHADLARFEELWGIWHLRDVMFRLTPGVGTILAAVDIVGDLQTEHGLDWRDITAVNVGLRPFAVGHGGEITHPTDAVTAHFSLAFSVALRLTTGASAPEHYIDPAMWADPDVLAATELVKAYPHEFGDHVPLLGAKVDIEMNDGRVLSGEQDGFRGSPQVPASPERIVGKFRANVAGQLSDVDANALLDIIGRLETVEHIGDLTRLLVAAADAEG